MALFFHYPSVVANLSYVLCSTLQKNCDYIQVRQLWPHLRKGLSRTFPSYFFLATFSNPCQTTECPNFKTYHNSNPSPHLVTNHPWRFPFWKRVSKSLPLEVPRGRSSSCFKAREQKLNTITSLDVWTPRHPDLSLLNPITLLHHSVTLRERKIWPRIPCL